MIELKYCCKCVNKHHEHHDTNSNSLDLENGKMSRVFNELLYRSRENFNGCQKKGIKQCRKFFGIVRKMFTKPTNYLFTKKCSVQFAKSTLIIHFTMCQSCLVVLPSRRREIQITVLKTSTFLQMSMYNSCLFLCSMQHSNSLQFF